MALWSLMGLWTSCLQVIAFITSDCLKHSSWTDMVRFCRAGSSGWLGGRLAFLTFTTNSFHIHYPFLD